MQIITTKLAYGQSNNLYGRHIGTEGEINQVNNLVCLIIHIPSHDQESIHTINLRLEPILLFSYTIH